MKPSGPGGFCFGKLLIINLISLIHIYLFQWSVSSGVSSCVNEWEQGWDVSHPFAGRVLRRRRGSGDGSCSDIFTVSGAASCCGRSSSSLADQLCDSGKLSLRFQDAQWCCRMHCPSVNIFILNELDLHPWVAPLGKVDGGILDRGGCECCGWEREEVRRASWMEHREWNAGGEVRRGQIATGRLAFLAQPVTLWSHVVEYEILLISPYFQSIQY